MLYARERFRVCSGECPVAQIQFAAISITRLCLGPLGKDSTMPKTMLFVLLATLVTCNLLADDEVTHGARTFAFPHATGYCNPYLLESASELPAATLSSIAELLEL